MKSALARFVFWTGAIVAAAYFSSRAARVRFVFGGFEVSAAWPVMLAAAWAALWLASRAASLFVGRKE
jgi:hypothetical protein